MAQLVGILNITPDSFSDGGTYFAEHDAIERTTQLFADGAGIVDIGAESTRPGAQPLTADEEWQRLEPVLKVLLPMYPGLLSLDTYHPENVARAFSIGDVIVNDVTGMTNPAMVDIISELNPRVIVSQLPSADIQKAHTSKAPVSTVQEVKDDLLAKVRLLKSRGVDGGNIILDPGIGFGKTMELNAELVRFAEEVPEYQVMIGYSRKRFLGEGRMELAPNLEAGRIALSSGAALLRVHDVAGHRQLLDQ